MPEDLNRQNVVIDWTKDWSRQKVHTVFIKDWSRQNVNYLNKDCNRQNVDTV